MRHRPRPSPPFVITLAIAAAASACGSGETAGSTGGTGGISGSGGAAGGSGGNPAGCPATAPVGGQACSLASTATCNYGDCCPTPYVCQNKVWAMQGHTCNPPALQCPSTPPVQGATCDYCAAQPGPCTWDACADGGTVTTATCDKAGWHVTGGGACLADAG